MRWIATTLALALVSSLPAQNRVETFTFPDGTLIPGWTAQWYTWKILNKRLVPTGGRNFHYITNNAISGVKDCVLDVEVIYPTVVSLHYGGVCARHPGGSGENGLVMTKLQDNSSGGTYNSTWLYERPGGAIAVTGTAMGTTKHAVVRMFVKGNTARFEVDKDMDGIFDVKSAVKTFSNTATNPSGLVGICGYNAAEMDNWKFYEAWMIEDPTTTPTIGTTYKMIFESPLHGGATPRPTPWLGLLSAGNKGFPLTNGVHIPLTFDALLVNSLGFGWSGVLTSTAPKGTLALNIPNMQSLVGLKLYAAAITLGSGRPGGWGFVSNAHGFVIK